MLPTDSTVDTLIGSFEPPRIARGDLAPNQYVLEARRRKESQHGVRDSGLFRG